MKKASELIILKIFQTNPYKLYQMPHFSFIPIIDFIKPDYGLWNESVIEAENGNLYCCS
jgi:hypothetical protein